MSSILLADIGATNSRFAVIGANGRPDRVIKFRGDAVASLEAGIERYMTEADVKPRAAVLAVAAPFSGDEVVMTNRPWRFTLSGLASRFGWTWVRGVNDFEAAAWSLPRLVKTDIQKLGPEVQGSGGCRVIFGPGTGLGVALLNQSDGRWTVQASEGGHASFGPALDDEQPVFAQLRAALGAVSVERVISGPGLERLHHAMHARMHASAATIVANAHGGDVMARQTVAMFVRLMGRFAGDLALTFKAFGGVYIGGGVARRIGSFFEDPAFRTAFENHPPYGEMLARVPTTLITLDEPGLLGCAAIAETMPAVA
jgi:glucokinase